MKRVLGLTSAVVLCLILTHCNSNNQGTQAPLQSGPSWTLGLKGQCEEQSDTCLAKYGFTVDALGNYQMGPAPNGQVEKGILAPSELKLIQDALNKAVPGTSARAIGSGCLATNESTDLKPFESGELTLSRPGKPTLKLVSLDPSGKLCLQSASLDAAQGLQNTILKLVEAKYDGMAFPSACRTELASLDQAYTQVKSCTQDSDCTYVDQNFDTTPRLDIRNYTWRTMPLVVANANLLKENADSLQESFNQATSACSREQVLTIDSYDVVTTGAPRCERNHCRAQYAQ